MEHTVLSRPEGPRRAEDSTPYPHFGDYELIEEIAHGGMGIVYRARQVSLNRVVAVKMILARQLEQPNAVKRFHTEAEAAAQLQHPHIVAIHEVGEIEGQHFFSMDFVEGQSLAKLVREYPLAPRQAAEYLAQIAEAIHYAHQRGVLHRDLKPSNVLIDQNDQPRVTDFGLAKLAHDDSELTLSGQTIGTPSYMAPEQAEGRADEVTVRTDVYALGAMLYELVTGRPPFKAESSLATLKQVVEQEPVSPRAMNPKVPLDLETICLKCLNKEPAKRYGSAQELAEELKRFLKQEPILARPVSAPEKVWRWCRRNPRLAGALAACLVTLVAGVVVSSWQWQRATSEAARQRLYAYGSDIRAAQVALDEGNLAQARDLLLRHVPRSGESDLRGIEWRYLWQQSQGEEVKSFAHPRSVNCVAWSPDGRLLATGCLDNKIRIWDVASGKVVRTFDGPGPDVPAGRWWISSPWMGFTTDGRWFTAQTAKGYTVWETSQWLPMIHAEKKCQAMHLAPHGHRLALIVDRGFAFCDTLRPDFSSELELAALKPDSRPSWFSTDGRRLALGYANGGVDLWNLEDDSKTMLALPGKPMVNSAVFSPDGHWLAVGWGRSPPSELFFWDLAQHQRGVQFKLPGARTYGLAFSPDSQVLATALGGTQTIDLWATATSNRLATLKGHADVVWGLAFSADGRWLASAGKDGTVKIWDAMLKQRTKSLSGAQTNLNLCGFTADGKQMVAQTAQPALELRRLPDGQVVRTIEVPEAALLVHWPRFTVGDFKDLRSLADKLRGGSNAVSRFLANALSARTRELLRDNAGSPTAAPLLGAALADDCNRLISGPCLYEESRFAGVALSSPTRARLRAKPQGESLVRLNRYLLEECYRAEISDVQGEAAWVQAFPEQGLFLVQTPDGELRAQRLLTGERLQTVKLPDFLPGDDDSPWSHGTCRLSPDGHLLFGVLSLTKKPWTGALYDLRNGRRSAVFVGLEEISDTSTFNRPVAFSPDSRWFAYPDTNHWIHIWDVAANTERTVLRVPARRFCDLAFSPDAKLLAAVGEESLVRLWDIGSGRLLHPPMRGHKATIQQVQFSPEGKTLLSVSPGSERSIRFWNVASGQEILILKDLTGIALSDPGVQYMSLISPDGNTLAWADAAENVRLTPLPTLAQMDQQIQTEAKARWGEALSSPDLAGDLRFEGSTESHPIAALSRERSGDLEEALQHYSPLLQEQPGDPGLWQLWGMLLEKTNRVEEAVQAYTRALDSAGTNADPVRIRRQVLLQRSDAFCRLNRLAESRADCRTLLETCPLSAVEATGLGLKYCDGPVEQRDPDKARLFLQHAARLPLSNSTALADLGKAYYRVGQFSNAVERVLESARLGGQARARHFFILCLSYASLGQTDKARDYYERGAADLTLGEGQGYYSPGDINRLKPLQAEAEQALGLSKPK